jgi:uncharacterized protein (TIGR00251 family)
MGRIRIRVGPRASRNAVIGVDAAGWLRVKLTAPPVEGAANKALVAFLAKRLGVAAGTIRILRGAASRNKVVEVDGWTDAGLRERLEGTRAPDGR